MIIKLKKYEPVLLEAMNGRVSGNDLEKMKELLEALRIYNGTGTNKYGYNYLSNNIRNPKINHVQNLLHYIGMYHESTSSEGNLGSFTKDYYEITFENHKKLFEYFPNYLHPDTAIGNKAILDGAEKFLESVYWKSRISLTHRQIHKYNLGVYIYTKNLCVEIIDKIEEEVKY